MANINSPRDGSRIPAVLAKDTVSAKAIAVSGILAGSTEGLAVAIIDGSGAQITSFGGGTQYVDAASAAAHPTGTGIIFNNGGTYNFVATAQPLPITIISGNPTTIAVTGTFWQATQPITKLPSGATAISGIATTTGTTDTAVIAAQGTGVFIYITSISIANTGSSTSLLTVETDTASAKTAMWYLINPAGGGDNITFDPPLKATASNKNVGFVAATGSTTQYVSYNGYFL